MITAYLDQALRRARYERVNWTVGRWLPPGVLGCHVAGIPGRVHVDDQMYRSDAPEHVQHYVDDAQSALDNVTQSLAAVGRSLADVEACLDFACGYGRVSYLAHLEWYGPEFVAAADRFRAPPCTGGTSYPTEGNTTTGSRSCRAAASRN